MIKAYVNTCGGDMVSTSVEDRAEFVEELEELENDPEVEYAEVGGSAVKLSNVTVINFETVENEGEKDDRE